VRDLKRISWNVKQFGATVTGNLCEYKKTYLNVSRIVRESNQVVYNIYKVTGLITH